MVQVGGGFFEREGYPVALSSFFISNAPVTYWKYGLFRYSTRTEEQLKENIPSWGFNGSHPAIYVCWYDAIEYCNWLSEAVGLEKVYILHKGQEDPNNLNKDDGIRWLVEASHAATGYRLPTEAEWEFAARARGHRGEDQFSGSSDLDEVGWYNKNSGNQTHPIAKRVPNELGVYDMSGNVWEWCWDWYDEEYFKSSQGVKDPKGPESGSFRVLRGGSWHSAPRSCQLAHRSHNYLFFRGNREGFRLVRASHNSKV